MFGVKAKITKCIDDEGYPSFVKCEFVDSSGQTQIFHDKDAIFTTENLDRNSNYPINGIIGCEIIEKKEIERVKIIKIDTEKPWHIESIKEETIFEVLEDQLVEFEHLGK